jgi:alkylated DNA repair protein alkB family protein 8
VIAKAITEDVDARAADGEAVVLSKNAAKKEAKKAAKAAAKAKAKAARATVTAHDGTVFEKKEKVRSCPACPESLLTAAAVGDTKEATEEDGGVPIAEALPSVERLHVQSVYDAVAKQWHGTRYRAWSGVEDFIRRHVQSGSLVADVGCGNGKNLPEVESLGRQRRGLRLFNRAPRDLRRGERPGGVRRRRRLPTITLQILRRRAQHRGASPHIQRSSQT